MNEHFFFLLKKNLKFTNKMTCFICILFYQIFVFYLFFLFISVENKYSFLLFKINLNCSQLNFLKRHKGNKNTAFILFFSVAFFLLLFFFSLFKFTVKCKRFDFIETVKSWAADLISILRSFRLNSLNHFEFL